MTLKCLIICCIAMTSMSCWAQNDLEQFEKQFFSPVQISKLGTDQGQSASLSSTSRSDLSAARKTLIDFFYATENVNADPRMYLEQVFASKYKERSDIGRSLFGEETTLLTVGFTGFSIRESTAELRFYVVIFAEGEIVANKSSARLRKMGGGWKITEVGGLK